MSANNVNFPAAEGSDILVYQLNTSPSGGSIPMAIHGYPVDIGGELSDIKQTNTIVGEFTGRH